MWKETKLRVIATLMCDPFFLKEKNISGKERILHCVFMFFISILYCFFYQSIFYFQFIYLLSYF